MPCMHLECSILTIPRYFTGECQNYAERVFNKCGLTETVWGFIDGTLQNACCPSYFQKLMYSGHKCCHGIKFQSIVTPDSLFASIYSPVNGNWHDSFLLSTSVLLDKLHTFMPDLPGRDVFSLYGDPANPQTIYIFGGEKNPLNSSTHTLWKTSMSNVCKVVEWAYTDILSQWSFLDFRDGMKIFQSPVAKYCIVGAFLVNLQTCFHGIQTMDYFDCETLSLH